MNARFTPSNGHLASNSRLRYFRVKFQKALDYTLWVIIGLKIRATDDALFCIWTHFTRALKQWPQHIILGTHNHKWAGHGPEQTLNVLIPNSGKSHGHGFMGDEMINHFPVMQFKGGGSSDHF